MVLTFLNDDLKKTFRVKKYSLIALIALILILMHHYLNDYFIKFYF